MWKKKYNNSSYSVRHIPNLWLKSKASKRQEIKRNLVKRVVKMLPNSWVTSALTFYLLIVVTVGDQVNLRKKKATALKILATSKYISLISYMLDKTNFSIIMKDWKM